MCAQGMCAPAAPEPHTGSPSGPDPGRGPEGHKGLAGLALEEDSPPRGRHEEKPTEGAFLGWPLAFLHHERPCGLVERASLEAGLGSSPGPATCQLCSWGCGQPWQHHYPVCAWDPFSREPPFLCWKLLLLMSGPPSYLVRVFKNIYIFY